MTFEQIYQFFQEPPPIYLNKELAVCYILSVFLQRYSYGSDTVLYSALKFLEKQGTITGYWQKVEGRGRPRRMYQILPEHQPQAQELAGLWYEYTSSQGKLQINE